MFRCLSATRCKVLLRRTMHIITLREALESYLEPNKVFSARLYKYFKFKNFGNLEKKTITTVQDMFRPCSAGIPFVGIPSLWLWHYANVFFQPNLIKDTRRGAGAEFSLCLEWKGKGGQHNYFAYDEVVKFFFFALGILVSDSGGWIFLSRAQFRREAYTDWFVIWTLVLYINHRRPLGIQPTGFPPLDSPFRIIILN